MQHDDQATRLGLGPWNALRREALLPPLLPRRALGAAAPLSRGCPLLLLRLLGHLVLRDSAAAAAASSSSASAAQPSALRSPANARMAFGSPAAIRAATRGLRLRGSHFSRALPGAPLELPGPWGPGGRWRAALALRCAAKTSTRSSAPILSSRVTGGPWRALRAAGTGSRSPSPGAPRRSSPAWPSPANSASSASSASSAAAAAAVPGLDPCRGCLPPARATIWAACAPPTASAALDDAGARQTARNQRGVSGWLLGRRLELRQRPEALHFVEQVAALRVALLEAAGQLLGFRRFVGDLMLELVVADGHRLELRGDPDVLVVESQPALLQVLGLGLERVHLALELRALRAGERGQLVGRRRQSGQRELAPEVRRGLLLHGGVRAAHLAALPPGPGVVERGGRVALVALGGTVGHGRQRGLGLGSIRIHVGSCHGLGPFRSHRG